MEGDALSLGGRAEQYGRDVGVYGTVVYYAVSGVDVSNYNLSESSTAVSAKITPRTLTVKDTSLADKVYDGTTIAGSIQYDGTLENVVEGDHNYVQFFAVADRLSGKDVGTRTSKVSYFIFGGLESNYAVADQTVNNVVTPKPLTISGTTLASRAYDGTKSPGVLTLGTMSGLIGDEVVTASGNAGELSGSDIGTHTSRVTYSLTDGINGGLASNYSLSSELISNEITSSADTSFAWQAAVAARNLVSDYQAINLPVGINPLVVLYSAETADIENIKIWRKKK